MAKKKQKRGIPDMDKIPPPPDPPPLRTIKGAFKKGGLTSEEFEEQNAERAIRRRETEIQLVNVVGGFLGIGTLIYAGFAYGIEMSIILVLIVISNNLCNVK